LAIRTRGTKRKRSGRPRATRRAITAAIDRIADLYFAIDVDSGEILDANPAAGSALGVARDALIGIEFNAFVPSDAQAPWWTSLDTIAEGEDSTRFQGTMQDREGRRIRLEASATRYLRSNRTLALVVARPDSSVQAVAQVKPAVPAEDPGRAASRTRRTARRTAGYSTDHSLFATTPPSSRPTPSPPKTAN
jgi:PAS domain S-box-containing protein